MEFHFLRVGCGNMTMILFPGGTVWFYDCNITEENESAVFSYLQRVMVEPFITTFVCSHRDADHMRGIKKLHARYPILRIRDAGVPGTTTTSNEYFACKLIRALVELVPEEQQGLLPLMLHNFQEITRAHAHARLKEALEKRRPS